MKADGLGRRDLAGLPEHVRAGEGRVSAEVDLDGRREPSQVESVRGPIEKRGLRQVHLAGDVLHPHRVARLGQHTDRRRVAGEGLGGERIDANDRDRHRATISPELSICNRLKCLYDIDNYAGRPMTLDEQLLQKARAEGERFAEAERQALLARTDYHTVVRRLHLSGGSLREIALALGLSHQRVQQIVKGAGGSWWQRVWRSRNITRDAVCTFCDRASSEVAKLIAGPNVVHLRRVRHAGREGRRRRERSRSSGDLERRRGPLLVLSQVPKRDGASDRRGRIVERLRRVSADLPSDPR